MQLRKAADTGNTDLNYQGSTNGTSSMKRIILWATVWLCAANAAQAASGPVLVTLATDIDPSAAPGRPVQFLDGACRYGGQLVREPGSAGITTTVIDNAGGDSGVWHVRIATQVCRENGDQVRNVALRVDLPHPPSLAGGGGVPPVPRGYQAGERFELRAR